MRTLLGGLMAAVAATLWVCGAVANDLHLEGDLTQGGLVRGQVAPGARVEIDGRPIRVSADGWFGFGLGRDAPAASELVVIHADGREQRRSLAIEQRDYQVQRIDGLPARQVEPNAEDLARIGADSALINQARRRDSANLDFVGPIEWPVTGPISGIYGSQRILNGKPRSPHRGVDVAAPEGTAVGAMVGGVVSLAETDMYFTGGTVMVDHGHGLQSIYVHLDQVLVAVGERLAPGAVLGMVGMTGRATGPHLHWGVYWFDQALDPQLLVGPMPQS